MTAEAPGRTVTSTPASRAAATRRMPGSLIPGRPASLTSAIRAPAASCASTAVRASCLVVAVVAPQRAGADAVPLEQALRMPRVLAEHQIRLAELLQHA